MTPAAFSAAAVAAAVWAWLCDVDTGLLGLLRRLTLAPGALLARALARREHVFREALRLFVFANLVFFLLAPHVGLFAFTLESLEAAHPAYPRMTATQQADLGLSRAVYEERFDNHLSFRQPTFAALLVPLLALLAKLFDLRRPYGVHLMTALYAVSWILLSWPVLLLSAELLAPLLRPAHGDLLDALRFALLLGAALQWFARAQHGGYGRAWPAALLQAALLTASWVLVMALYGQALFWLTWALLPAG